MEGSITNTALLNGPRTRRILVSVISMLCLFLFAISACDKIVDHERFMKGLEKVRGIGNFAALISWVVPIAEILTCILLSLPKTLKLGLLAFIGLMVVFTLYIASMLLWAEKLPCHCNLIIEKLSFGEHLVFNMTFIALAIIGLWLKKYK